MQRRRLEPTDMVQLTEVYTHLFINQAVHGECAKHCSGQSRDVGGHHKRVVFEQAIDQPHDCVSHGDRKREGVQVLEQEGEGSSVGDIMGTVTPIPGLDW